MICSDRTQCEVCFEMKAFLSLSLISRSSLPLSGALQALGWEKRKKKEVQRGPVATLGECVLGVCLWAAKCPSNEDNDEKTASLAIFLMTADVFIWTVTLIQEAGTLLLVHSPFHFHIWFQWEFETVDKICRIHLKRNRRKHNRSS